MQDGIYRAWFATTCGPTTRGPTSGVAIIENGRIRGGDAMIYFDGTISYEDGVVKVAISAAQHTFAVPPYPSVIGAEKANITLEGRGERTQAMNISGPIEGDQNQVLQIMLHKVKD